MYEQSSELMAEQDEYLASIPMPEEYKDSKMTVLCNECLTESLVPFHINGGKCKQCGSYNTTRTKDSEARIAPTEPTSSEQYDVDAIMTDAVARANAAAGG